MNRTSAFWIGPLALAAVITAGASPALAGQTTKRSSTKTKSSAQTTQPRTAYSAARSQSRRSRLTAARMTAMAREMAESLPRYKVDASGDLVPDLRAAAAIVYDPETNQILWEENSQEQRSIASITKVMTATVFLEDDPDLSQPVTIARSDVFQASTTHLRANDKVTVDDLLHLLLIASDNAAARALARVSIVRLRGIRPAHEREGGGARPRDHALRRSLGSAVRQQFVGLRHGASHLARVRRTSVFRRRCVLSEYTVYTNRRAITFHSTNHLLGRPDVDVLAGKTGFITKAGYCLATLLRMPESGQVGRGRRPRRAVERGTVHGIAESFQLGFVEGAHALRAEAHFATIAASLS